MLLRRRTQREDVDLRARVEVLEQGLQDSMREAAELRSAHTDAIELALISAVPNGIYRLVVDAGMIKLPVSDDETTQRQVEMDVRMRIGLLRAP